MFLTFFVYVLLFHYILNIPGGQEPATKKPKEGKQSISVMLYDIDDHLDELLRRSETFLQSVHNFITQPTHSFFTLFNSVKIEVKGHNANIMVNHRVQRE